MLRLTVFDKEFFVHSRRWLNDVEIKRLTMSSPCDEATASRWFESLGNKADYKIWGLQYDGIPIGACGIKHINCDSGEYWGYIGEKTYWGRGIGTIMLNLIEEEAKKLGICKLHLHVEKENLRALRLYKKIGFTPLTQTGDVLSMIKYL